MNPASRLGLFLILVSAIYIFARQPFFDRLGGWISTESGGKIASREIFFFTRSASIIFSLDVPGDVNSTLVFLKPKEIESYLRNQSIIGVEAIRYEGSFTTSLQIEHRGIHAIVLKFNPSSPFLGSRAFPQGISGSEYTDQVLVLIAGVLLSSPSFLKRLKLIFQTGRDAQKIQTS
ncbi:MAG: hypothetical protein ACUVQY_01800 [Thermoproteota archaeon]